MAHAVLVPGKSEVKIGSGTQGALESLGYSMNGVEIRWETYRTRVPGDQNGGELGPPIEKQVFGHKAIVRVELSKFDATVARKVDKLLNGMTGEVPVGTLLYGSVGYYRLVIDNTNDPYTFYNATPIEEPRELNVGSRWQRRVYTFECEKDPNPVSASYEKVYANVAES